MPEMFYLDHEETFCLLPAGNSKARKWQNPELYGQF